MGWDLGKVKPWVKTAGEYFGKKYSIKNIGGWRAHGSVPGSLHPLGRALDVMTSDREKGDAIAADAIANHKALGITQVIWYRRIWTPERGWHAYNGPVPHTDHVHLSFADHAGSGKLEGLGAALGGIVGTIQNGPKTLVDAISNIGDQLGQIGQGVASVGKVAEGVTKLMLPTNLLRVWMGGLGMVFLLIGIFFLSREARS